MFGARQGFKDLVNKTYGPCKTNIVKPAGTRMSLVSLAAESGSVPALQFLVGTGAENSEGTQPLELALRRGDKTIRQYLLSLAGESRTEKLGIHATVIRSSRAWQCYNMHVSKS